MTRVFKSKQIIQTLTAQELENLVNDFKAYKSGEYTPDLFGRDVLYDHMDTPPLVKQEEVQHIHLLDKDHTYPFHAIQFSKTSDTHLVYCQGFANPNCYLLMAILSPNAHDLAKSPQVMHQLGIMAEAFRLKY
ncbi:MAG: type II toxin-antitoxin system YafO family toxin [Pseudoalteromonas marina]